MGRPGQDFDDCGFHLEIDLAQLAQDHPPTDGTDTWRLRFVREVDTLSRRGGVTGYRTDAVDRSWQPVHDDVEARLRDVEGSLVLDLRPVMSRKGSQSEYADSQRSSSSYTRSRAG
jgi:hypothetical protein